jgi:DNA-binding NarL/FixJ family response regulator
VTARRKIVLVKRVLIVGDDKQLCECLQEMFSSWGMAAESVANPLLVADVIRQTFYHLILPDIDMPAMRTMELLKQIAELSPETKIIITGYVDKDKAITALRLGAFDFLERPLNTDLLALVVQRALNTQEVGREHKQALAELREKTTQLEEVNRELRDTNIALGVLAHRIERTKEETKRQMISTIRAMILPLIEQLRQDKRLEMCEPQLAMMVRHIEDLTDELAPSLHITSVLSSSELRVACLIREGMNSDKIASHLHLSPDTVKTHRRNIRRKLGLIRTNNDLRIYLQSL